MQKVLETEAGVAQVVERQTLKVNVASSTPCCAIFCKGNFLMEFVVIF